MVSFTFIVCAEPYKYEAVDTVINLGEAIIKKGHQILGIFLYGSGVYNIKERKITDSSERNLSERLGKFCEKYNAKLAACSTWISFTGIKSSEFMEGACQEGLGGLSDLISKSDKIIFFGPGR
ncbi:MAG: DsrE/DsrF/TusD sulfur relay family protein [Candidatus Hodarchaeota archaeon]